MSQCGRHSSGRTSSWSHLTIVRDQREEFGEMTQQVREHTALAEDLGWVPSTQLPLTQVPGDPTLSSDSIGTCVNAHMPY